MYRAVLFGFFLLIPRLGMFALSDSLKFQSTIYGEAYYLTSVLKEKDPIFYNHTSTNHPAVNLALWDFSVEKKKWKFQSGFMLGTYVNKNLAQEPNFLKPIYQLNAVYQVNLKHQLMAGVFPSHIGLESVMNNENECFSRSYLAENSPYYETGLSWTHTVNSRFLWRVLALTGWQHMAKWNPALGGQFTYLGSSGLKINASQFIGNEGKGTRVFWNNYTQANLAKNLSATLGFDIGTESGEIWHGGLFYLTWSPTKKLKLSGRLEYYSDSHAIIMPQAFNDHAQSISVHISLGKQFMLRSEIKNSAKFGNEFMCGALILVSHSQER